MDLRRSFGRMLEQALIESLDEAGFVKHRLTFTRRRQFWVEHFIFQRSKYNLNKIRCRYYLDVGLEFPILPRAGVWAFHRMSGMVNWRGKQSVPVLYAGPQIAWATRADALVRGLPSEWEVVPATDFELLRPQISAALVAAGRGRDHRFRVSACHCWWAGFSLLLLRLKSLIVRVSNAP
jgi:hypothetical protein